MYYILTVFTGVLIALMLACNGGLSAQYGVYSSTLLIHAIGLALIGIYILIKKENPFSKRHPFVFYLGGAIGVGTTVLNNVAFTGLNVSAIMAVGLLGQTVMSLFVDQFGLLGMPVRRFYKEKFIGLIFILCGIIAMVTEFHLVAVLASFAAGISLILSRALNGELAKVTSDNVSTFFTYLIGLVVSLPLFFLLGRGEDMLNNFVFSPNLFIYLGSIFGVTSVLLTNVVVKRISSFYTALFLFVGQVVAGLIIDMILSQSFSLRNLIGGILVGIGMSINLYLDKRSDKKKEALLHCDTPLKDVLDSTFTL